MLFQDEISKIITRRTFLRRSTTGLGALALSSLLNERLFAADSDDSLQTFGALNKLHFAPRAKRVIYLFQSGAPSHIDLFDPKPKLKELAGKELPKSVRGDQRITGMTSGQAQLLVAGSPLKLEAHGRCGTEISELLPNTAKIVDDIALIRGMYTEPIN